MVTVVRSRTVIATGFIIFLIIATIKGNAQQGRINLHKPVVVQKSYIQLDSLLRLITKQTGAKFSLNSRKFPATRSIHINQHKQTIEDLLQTIKRNTGVYYALLGDHIILLDNPPPKKKNSDPVTTKKKPNAVPPRLPAKTSTSQTGLPSNKPTTVKPATTINKSQPPVTPANTVNKKTTTETETPADKNELTNSNSLINKAGTDTLKNPAATLPVKDSTTNKPVVKNHTTAGNSNNTASKKNSAKERRSILSDLFVKPGFSADDVFYVNPTVHIGHPWLYGIASWSTNFKIHGFRYGAGSSIRFNEDWKLHLQFTTGIYSSSVSNTISMNWQFITNLHKAGIIAEKKLNDRFSIQFGPVLNSMRLTYYRNGEKTTPGITEESANKIFTLIRPVYTLSDNYSTQNIQSSKLWVGLQVSFFYNLHFFKSQ